MADSFDYGRLNEELEDCGDDVDLWLERKLAENETFYGLEVDPEKMKRLNRLRDICKRLCKLSDDITQEDFTFDNEDRHGSVAIKFPNVCFLHDDRTLKLLALLFHDSDGFTMTTYERVDDPEEAMRIFYEYGALNGGNVKMTFTINDMWKSYGKMPF